MVSTFIGDVDRQCAGKRTYIAKRDAKAAARGAERFLGRMVAYRCPHCTRWHVGHPVKRGNT